MLGVMVILAYFSFCLNVHCFSINGRLYYCTPDVYSRDFRKQGQLKQTGNSECLYKQFGTVGRNRKGRRDRRYLLENRN